MNTVFHDQALFLEQSKQVELPRNELIDLYVKLIDEEAMETISALEGLKNLSDIAASREDQLEAYIDLVDGAIDVIYVAAGLLNAAIGPDKAQALWDVVQAKNMRKLVDNETREDGKVLKSEEWKRSEAVKQREAFKRVIG